MKNRAGLSAAFRVLGLMLVVACGAADDREEVGSVQGLIDSNQALVIREIYMRGPGTPATFSRSFVEIYNKSSASASLAGLVLNVGPPSFFYANVHLPAVILAPGQSFLVASGPAD